MNERTAIALAELLYADRTLIDLYQAATSALDGETSELLRSATDDHRRHESLLLDALEDAQMQQYEPGEDMKQLFDEHRRHIHDARDAGQVLDALKLAEQLNAMLYEAAEREDLSEELADLIAESHADEHLHASMIAEAPRPEAMSHSMSCVTGFTDDISPDDFD